MTCFCWKSVVLLSSDVLHTAPENDTLSTGRVARVIPPNNTQMWWIIHSFSVKNWHHRVSRLILALTDNQTMAQYKEIALTCNKYTNRVQSFYAWNKRWPSKENLPFVSDRISIKNLLAELLLKSLQGKIFKEKRSDKISCKVAKVERKETQRKPRYRQRKLQKEKIKAGIRREEEQRLQSLLKEFTEESARALWKSVLLLWGKTIRIFVYRSCEWWRDSTQKRIEKSLYEHIRMVETKKLSNRVSSALSQLQFS